MDEKKVVRVGIKSEPSKVASSILYFLESGVDIEVSALGSSSGVLAKSIALVENLNHGKIPVSYHPRMTYVTDDYGITRSAVQFLIVINR